MHPVSILTNSTPAPFKDTEEEELSREEGGRSGRGVTLMHTLLQQVLSQL